MKPFFSTLLLLATALSSSTTSGQISTISGLELQVTKMSPSGTISVDIRASSGKTLRIWDDEFSLGAGHWRVVIVRSGHIDTFFESPFQVFVKNTPSFKEVAPGQHITKLLDLNGGNWCGLGQCSGWDQRGFGSQKVTLQSGDSVIVTYDVPPTVDAKQMGVWWGAASAISSMQ
jgi:hypothetical protein